jgi:hypothetical protein
MSVLWDVDSIKNRIVARLQSKVSWANILYYSANMRLISAISEEIADLANYDEYLTRETTWSLARNRSSLLAMEAIHKYAAHRKIGAFGTVRVGVSTAITSSTWLATTNYTTGQIIYYNDILYTALQNSINQQPDIATTYWVLTNIAPTVNVDIPKWTVFSDSTGTYKFTSYITENLTTSDNFIDIDVVEGLPKSVTYTASGIDNEEFILDESDIENSRFELYVNNVLWTNVTSLLEQASTTLAYEIENKLDFTGIYIKFGNDIYGKKLSTGDIVKFYYVSTSGILGNVESSNVINTIDSSLYDVNNTKVTAYCTNTDSLQGGKDEEDIEQVRLNAPKIFQTGDRASSYTDYPAIINTFSFVKKSSVWGAYEYNIDRNQSPWTFIAAEENVVHVAGINQSDSNFDTTQKLSISSGINSYKAPTDILQFETVKFLNLAFRTTAYISNRSYTLSTVANSIRAILASTYSVDNLDFYQSIYFSDYQTLIDSVAGVDHHTTYVEIYYDYSFQAAYVCSLNLPSYPIHTSTIYLYVQDTTGGQTTWTLIGVDNGSSGFTAETGYDLTGSQINYSTGYALISVNSGLSQPYTNYTFRVFYQESTNDLVLNTRADIFKFSSSESTITTQYI